MSNTDELDKTLYGMLHPEKQESFDNLLNGIACHYERLGKGITTPHAADKYTLEYVYFQLQSLIEHYALKKQIEDWKKACRDNWQCPIPEQYALDHLKELNKQLEGGK